MSETVHHRAIMWFRRDLRLNDNTALYEALRAADEVVPVFILDPQQTDATKNSYFSRRAFSFMLRALEDLNDDLCQKGGALHVAFGAPRDVLPQIVKRSEASALYFNRDYTPFARRRDSEVVQCLRRLGISIRAEHDALLVPPTAVTEDVLWSMRKYRQAVSKLNIYGPASWPGGKVVDLRRRLRGYLRSIPMPPSLSAEMPTAPGRRAALQRLRELKAFASYSRTRHYPAKESLTGLSPHLKFGSISAREMYAAIIKQLGERYKLATQLRWRDLYTSLAYHRPDVFGQELQEGRRDIQWRHDPEGLEAWKEGRTGYPFVDAGMRQLANTGYMHNRARMTVASFLSKHLLVDWREGERHFAQQLVDYDPSVNNGNWQWSASVGTDRLIRVFSPYKQAQKYDRQAKYIKRWVPELRQFSADQIVDGTGLSEANGYPEPIVDHRSAYTRARKAYSQANFFDT